jgi:quercetin dioxygenase-like cupin family protein
LQPGHPTAVDQHDWDQTMFFLEGVFEITLDDKDVYLCKAGDVLYIPGGIRHAGVVRGDKPIYVLQVFAPIRDDYRALAENE